MAKEPNDALLLMFDASAPSDFAAAFIKTYDAHEEDTVRRSFFSVTCSEQNHECRCGMPHGPVPAILSTLFLDDWHAS